MIYLRNATFTTDDELDAPDAQSTVVVEPEPEVALKPEPEVALEPVEKSYAANTSTGSVSKQVFSSHSRIEETVSDPSDYENDEQIRTSKIYVYKVIMYNLILIRVLLRNFLGLMLG